MPMPRTSTDFSGLDPGEAKNLSIGFGVPGQSTSNLAAGETVVSVTFQISVISGNDPSPASRLIGLPVVQPGGLAVTQKVGTLQPGDHEQRPDAHALQPSSMQRD
jgi:hypothetical protein